MKNVHHQAKWLKIRMRDEGYNLTVELNNIKISFTVFEVSEQKCRTGLKPCSLANPHLID